MADVFISYAHEDQPFARRMVPALEAEGFSVWWDHTIPPGQSWDTFIARNIEDARCCIVLWSGRSVGSDWVKEEATLAKDAGKLIPVQIDTEAPPVGFRRIQAAQLLNWSGDTNNPQWQLLVGEVRRIVGASREGGAPAPRRAPSYTPPPPAPEAKKKGPLLAIAGALVGVVVILAGVFLYNQWQQAQSDARVLRQQLAEQTLSRADTTATPTTTATTQTDAAAEIERLRRERDSADARAERERLERQAAERRAAQQQQQTQQQQRAQSSVPSAVGTWRGSFTYQDMDTEYHVWELRSDHTVRRDGEASGTWSQSGANVRIGSAGTCVYSGVISGNRISGAANCANPPPGVFSMTRQ